MATKAKQIRSGLNGAKARAVLERMKATSKAKPNKTMAAVSSVVQTSKPEAPAPVAPTEAPTHTTAAKKGFNPDEWIVPDGFKLRTSGSQGNARGPWCESVGQDLDGQPKQIKCPTCGNSYKPNVVKRKAGTVSTIPYHPIPGARLKE